MSASVPPGVTPVPNDLLDMIHTELESLNKIVGSMSTFMGKVLGDKAQDVRDKRWEEKLGSMYTKDQEKALKRLDFQGQQLKELVDLNESILKETQKTAKATEAFHTAQKDKDYQGRAKGIGQDYLAELRKSQNRNTLGTLGHHLSTSNPGITNLLGMIGRKANVPGLRDLTSHKAPGDFMFQKRQEEQNIKGSAYKKMDTLNADTQGVSAVGAEKYNIIKKHRQELEDDKMRMLEAQRGYLSGNYKRGYKRRSSPGKAQPQPGPETGKAWTTPPRPPKPPIKRLFRSVNPEPTSAQGASPPPRKSSALRPEDWKQFAPPKPSILPKMGEARGTAITKTRGLTTAQQADLAPAKMVPSPADVARQTSGTGQGFLLLYNLLNKKEDTNPLKDVNTSGGGGLMGDLTKNLVTSLVTSLLPALATAVLSGPALLAILGTAVGIALISSIVTKTMQDNAMAKDIQKKEGLTPEEVAKGNNGGSGLAPTLLDARDKNGPKSSVSLADANNTGGQVLITPGTSLHQGTAMVKLNDELSKTSPWLNQNQKYRFTSQNVRGVPMYYYGGVLVNTQEAKQSLMDRSGEVAVARGVKVPMKWDDFALKMQGAPEFYNGGMHNWPVGEARPMVGHGGELTLTSTEVSKLRQTAVNGGSNPDLERTLNNLLEVNRALLEEMRKNTQAVANQKLSVEKDTSTRAPAPHPTQSFQRSS